MLVLIIGGKSNGKYNSLLYRGFSKSQIEENLQADAVYKLNGVIKALMEQGQEPISTVLSAIENRSVTIVCDEVGCGIVPINQFEQDYRENVGRCCCEIAKRADEVYRVFASIEQRIK